MLNRESFRKAPTISHYFGIFTLLLLLTLILSVYTNINEYIANRKENISEIARHVQQRINYYRYITGQLYEQTRTVANDNVTDSDMPETRLRPDIYSLSSTALSSNDRKIHTLIFGNHDTNTRIMADTMTHYLETLWGGINNSYSMYYLNGQDNSLTLVTTQSLSLLTSHLKDNYLLDEAEKQKNEMLQQATMLDLREIISGPAETHDEHSDCMTISTSFNQPGHLTTVIAFDLPLNDIFPSYLKNEHFSLTSKNSFENSTLQPDTLLNYRSMIPYLVLSKGDMEISTSLDNGSLTLTYYIPIHQFLLDVFRNNIWLFLINFALFVFSLTSMYSIRRNLVHPNESMTTQLYSTQIINQEILANLHYGFMIYDISNEKMIASNNMATALLPHLNLAKIIHMTAHHSNVIKATINNDVYEITVINSKLSDSTYLFLLHDKSKEQELIQSLKKNQQQNEKNILAINEMLKNITNEFNLPLSRLSQIARQIHPSILYEKQEKLLSALLKESDFVIQLMDNLALLTSLDSDGWKPKEELFSLSTVFEEVICSHLESINQKGLLLFNYDSLPPQSLFRGNKDTIIKISQLLFTQAITNTDFGKIIIRLEHLVEQGIIITLIDTSKGLSNDEKKNQYFPFFSPGLKDRFENSSALTLYLCNQLCRQLSGELTISAKDELGTCYTLLLPLHPEYLLEEEEQDENNQHDDEEEGLLEGVIVLLNVESSEIKQIVEDFLRQHGAQAIFTDQHNLNQEYDLYLTDNTQIKDKYTLLVSGNKPRMNIINNDYVEANYNLGSTVIEAILWLIERQSNESNQTIYDEELSDEKIYHYKTQLRSSDYFDLFIATVPDDIKKLYTDAASNDVTSLSLTVHRLKGVFAMLHLQSGKQLCERLEHHIAHVQCVDVKTSSIISQIDFFVSKLLQQGNQST